MPNVKLNNGVLMPQEGFGVYQVPDYEQCKQAVKDALSVGYRAIDTAQGYQNEDAVGDAIAESDVDRKDIFITTKVWISNFGYEKTLETVNESLKKLKTDYLDLVLIHQPVADYYSAYRALEKLYNDGKIRAIGVSNMDPAKYVDFIMNNEVKPAVNQVETHVFNQQKTLRKYMNENDTQIESWAPFAEGKNNLFSNEVLNSIGEKYAKSAAQVALKFLAQSGVVIIPKSTHVERMKENIDIWDFELTEDEMNKISDLDLNKSLFLDHSNPETIKWLNQLKL
ncbi:aldo/keto reductase [Apilactobacillus micheneri]|uniref:Aldo/keto reductase n=1 Tax=Apilactobacillus micheneri TaxID=1899430 RepID=A0ABY2Z3L5_9LACO|nr:aldo/keto reductase [Apilactobacillus micheneri]TPR26516.1 aldo/keto reductase [Apilactobacillus micheneri]TPR27270.1 aldo/keto reductase [Apilactobacillus micheneri]TPR27506.1 aldo/keto reductase [Apilactobacillus micheneri]TPR32033.1 aldo/keto reductase [Apilactobacillus micheneri]TPR32437.1 aldo/keto reductase [Apilactobacillus micheneri]